MKRKVTINYNKNDNNYSQKKIDNIKYNKRKNGDIVIYIAGSMLLGNPGFGGYSAVLRCNNYVKVIQGWTKYTTNNRMELLAMYRALEAIKIKDISKYRIFMFIDSDYCINVLKTSNIARNKDIINPLKSLISIYKDIINISWVAYNSGDVFNDEADHYAKEAVGFGLSKKIDEDLLGVYLKK